MKTESISKKKRIALIFLGVIGTAGFTIVYDDILYPIVTYSLGVDAENMWKGFAVMFTMALIINYLLIRVYDLLHTDIFGFEEIKKLKERLDANPDSSIDQVLQSESETLTKKQKKILKYLKRGELILFLFLSWLDPFLATLWKRKSTKFDGFTKRDYKILVLSTFIGCFIWSFWWVAIGKIVIFVKNAIW